jgi:hypothetical protein
MSFEFNLAKFLASGGTVNGAEAVTGALTVAGAAAFSGNVALAHDPGSSLEAATKAYVDAHSGTGGISDAPNNANAYLRSGLAWTSGGQISGNLTVNGALQALGGLALNHSEFIELATVTANGATIINWGNGEVQKVSLTGNATINVTGWPASGHWAKLVLNITNAGAFAITGWPAGSIFPGGTAPTITSGAGKRDKVILDTDDGGATVWVSLAGQDYR